MVPLFRGGPGFNSQSSSFGREFKLSFFFEVHVRNRIIVRFSYIILLGNCFMAIAGTGFPETSNNPRTDSSNDERSSRSQGLVYFTPFYAINGVS